MSNFFQKLKIGFQKIGSIRTKRKKTSSECVLTVKDLADKLFTTTGKLYFLSKNADAFYKELVIPKKNGGERVLHTPRRDLKEVQRNILRYILSEKEISEYATAYRKGKSLFDNASPHVGHKYLLKMDISDFFGSITFNMVLSAAFPSKIYPKHVGVMLTSLCTKDSVLPQGAPTSPALSNIVMKNFDEILGSFCKEKGITYTRYCDDLTFSADTPLYSLSLKVTDMLKRRGFSVNQAKTHFLTNASSQRVTGLCVNEKVSIPKDYKRNLRQEVYYALKFGLAETIAHRGLSEYILEDGTLYTYGYFYHLLGCINYVLQMEPENKWFQVAKAKLLS